MLGQPSLRISLAFTLTIPAHPSTSSVVQNTAKFCTTPSIATGPDVAQHNCAAADDASEHARGVLEHAEYHGAELRARRELVHDVALAASTSSIKQRLPAEQFFGCSLKRPIKSQAL